MRSPWGSWRGSWGPGVGAELSRKAPRLAGGPELAARGFPTPAEENRQLVIKCLIFVYCVHLSPTFSAFCVFPLVSCAFGSLRPAERSGWRAGWCAAPLVPGRSAWSF